LQQQLRHADRLATIGQLAAGVAHELNEPLGNILGFAQLAKKASGLPEQTHTDLDKIISASLYAREVIRKLMLFARQAPSRKFPVSLNRVVEDSLALLESRLVKGGVEVVKHLHDGLPLVNADPAQLGQILINLAVNASQAMLQGGVLTISTAAEADSVSLIVEDTGEGMNPEVVQQIFIPFFTTKDVNQGTGLGLAVVHGIVTAHGGSIQVESELGKGSRFRVHLPVAESNSSEEKQGNDVES
jgi:signal transduction histidine kinase